MCETLTIDKDKVKSSFALAAHSYDELATLQRKVGVELLQKLSKKNALYPIVDMGCGTGFITQQLIDRDYLGQVIAIDIALSMVQKMKMKLKCFQNVAYICADAEFVPLENHSVDTIISNLALQWCQNLMAVFSGFNSILKKEGQLVFSTFGPRTLQELKQAWSEVDHYTHVNEFYSADDIHDFLKGAGFKNIKIEKKCYQSHYATVIELMRELKGIGAHNVLSQRNRKTTSKANMQAMISAYERNTGQNKISATYEILFVTAQGA
ncbi:MAG: malonyl-ACP O-methyltransferase BioC [Methylococcaceae bacterium]|nr:malonyl-ACP O-methyltransferase BioC [Methylococcaceae bacterium]